MGIINPQMLGAGGTADGAADAVERVGGGRASGCVGRAAWRRGCLPTTHGVWHRRPTHVAVLHSIASRAASGGVRDACWVMIANAAQHMVAC